MDAAPLAAFDVDGTLTTRDTLTPFLVQVTGKRRVAWAMTQALPAAARTRVDRRDTMKASVLADLLAGREHAHLVAAGALHAQRVAARRLRPDALACLRWHQAHGDHTVLVSASLRYYLEPLAALLGVDELLCTELEVGADGRLTGRLAGVNCRGPEKARRLQGRYGLDARPAWAYGNSTGDRELLALAGRPVTIRRWSPARVPAEHGP